MPSRYYNPRLAKNLANAYKQEVYDFSTPISEGFKPFLEMTEKRYQEKLKEKEKSDLQKEKIQKQQDRFFEDMPIVDPNTLDSSIRDFATKDMFDSQKEYQFAVENLQGYERIKRTGEIANNINYWKTINTKLASHQENYKDMHNPSQPGGDRMSKVNDGVTKEMDRRKAYKQFDAVIKGEDGRIYAVFEPEEDSAIEETVMIAFDDWDKSYIPIERQTKKYVDTLASFDKMIDVAKREKRWETDPANEAELESTLKSIEFSKDEALSIAVDQLGLSEESYAGTVMRDLDNDGVPGTIDDINMFIKDNLKQGVITQLTNLRRAYENQMKATTDTSSLTATELKAIESENKLNETITSISELKIPIDAKGNIQFGNSVFFNELANAGFIVTDIKSADDGQELVTIKNNYTNEVTAIQNMNLSVADFKRILSGIAGANREQQDKFFPKSFIGPQEEKVTLPGDPNNQDGIIMRTIRNFGTGNSQNTDTVNLTDSNEMIQ